MTALIKYNLKIYIKSYKYILPLIVMFAYISIAYQTGPIDIIGTFTLSSCILFLVIMWMGYNYFDSEKDVSEEVLILKCKSIEQYLLSKILLFLLVGVAFSIILVGAALLLGRFKPSLTILDIILALIIHLLFAVTGAVFGMLFSPRVLSNTSISKLLVITFGLIVVLKDKIIMEVPVFKFILWILPPTDSITGNFLKLEHYPISGVIIPFGLLIGYILIESFAFIMAVKKRLY